MRKLSSRSSKKLIRRTWIEALESGKYKKATGTLHEDYDGEKFCALGVLCDMAEKAGVVKRQKSYDSAPGTVNSYGYSYNTGDLPSEVVTWAGVTDAAGSFKLGGLDVTIPMLNDSNFNPKTLAEIGEIISKCPEGLFTECAEVDENREVEAV